jgi:hypothetical protein
MRAGERSSDGTSSRTPEFRPGAEGRRALTDHALEVDEGHRARRAASTPAPMAEEAATHRVNTERVAAKQQQLKSRGFTC